ncbi:helix-turn-helix transcriptional regulator [Candidatus Roizmanbacteria bacterium]|nr:helix-turn-helix transcriptional regulator [Candidatus Roizmanbacteria bacterium]
MRGNFFYQRLGERIIIARNKKKLSQEQVALLSDVDRTYLARIEEGKANPSIKILSKIARILRIRLNQLLIGV